MHCDHWMIYTYIQFFIHYIHVCSTVLYDRLLKETRKTFIYFVFFYFLNWAVDFAFATFRQSGACAPNQAWTDMGNICTKKICCKYLLMATHRTAKYCERSYFVHARKRRLICTRARARWSEWERTRGREVERETTRSKWSSVQTQNVSASPDELIRPATAIVRIAGNKYICANTNVYHWQRRAIIVSTFQPIKNAHLFFVMYFIILFVRVGCGWFACASIRAHTHLNNHFTSLWCLRFASSI